MGNNKLCPTATRMFLSCGVVKGFFDGFEPEYE